MEPITQGLLGAAIGQAGFARSLGRRALGWGALIGMLPDLDVIAAPLHGGFGEMIYHRGTTHALWFGPVAGSLLGWCLWRWRDGAQARLGTWIGLCVLVLFTHPLLDVFTPYGTQLFAPFSRERFAWNGIGIIDPIYSAMLALGLVAGRVSAARAGTAAAIVLALSTLYLGYGVLLNAAAERDLRRTLAAEGLNDASVRVYPTMFQPWLRRFVARTPEEVRVGLYTPWRPGEPWWESFTPPAPDPRVEDLLSSWRGRVFRLFAMGEISWRVRGTSDSAVVEVDDLRYGIPGDPPDQGLWGIRAAYDAGGRRTGPAERYARRRSGRIAPLLRSMWRATWGDFSDFSCTAGSAAREPRSNRRSPPSSRCGRGASRGR